MISRLNVATIYVLDKDEALDFYVNKLGLEKGNDVQQGDYRWVTVRVPGISPPRSRWSSRVHRCTTRRPPQQLRELITKGALGGLVFITDDARGLYETLQRAASPTSPRSRPSTSTAPTWACATLRQPHPDPPAGKGRPAGDGVTADVRRKGRAGAMT